MAKDNETDKFKFPLTYKDANDVLEKWEQCRVRLVELKQPSPNPLRLWPAVNRIMERVLTLDKEFDLQVTQVRINSDICENPTEDKILKMRKMYAVFCNQHIDSPKKAAPGPNGYEKGKPKKEPKGKGAGKKGDGTPKSALKQEVAPDLTQKQPVLAKLTIPGTGTKIDDADKWQKDHYQLEMKRLERVYHGGRVVDPPPRK